MTAPTLTDFLLARIEEDEAVAREAVNLSSGIGVTREWAWVRFWGSSERPQMPSSSSFYAGAPTPARVLAECEAKRAIVQGWGQFLAGAPEWAEREMPSVLRMARMTLHALALPYADHPDCRQEWKP